MVEQLPLLCYASQILAHLPYTASMDPLFIIYHVSNVIAVHGEPLLDRITHFLGPHSTENADMADEDYDDGNLEEDDLEKAAKSKVPSRTKAASVLGKQKFVLSTFAELCAEAAAMVLLIRLKNFLKKAYSLSEARCMEYNPNDKEKISDKNINLPEEIPMFNSEIEGFINDSAVNSVKQRSPYSSSALNKDALICAYAEFRRLMRTPGSGSVKVKAANDKEPENGDNGAATVTPKRRSTAKRAVPQASSKRKRSG